MSSVTKLRLLQKINQSQTQQREECKIEKKKKVIKSHSIKQQQNDSSCVNRKKK